MLSFPSVSSYCFPSLIREWECAVIDEVGALGGFAPFEGLHSPTDFHKQMQNTGRCLPKQWVTGTEMLILLVAVFEMCSNHTVTRALRQ